jgi:penicillin amidase
VWPGGASAVPTSPWYLNLLPLWLTNDTVPLHDGRGDLARDTASTERFVP